MLSTINILKTIDKIIGPVGLRLLPKEKFKKNYTAEKLKKILVIRPGGMGDAILLLPVLKAIYKQYQLKIDVLCEPRNAVAFQSVDFIENIFSYQNPKTFFLIRNIQYDLIFDTEQSHFLSAIMIRFFKAKIKIGFKTNGRDKLYNFSIPYDQNYYEAKMFWDLFDQAIGFNQPFGFDFPYFKKFDLPFRHENIVCFFPGATTEIRLWPENRWAEVIDWISDKGFNPILLGSTSEQEQCRKIVSFCKSQSVLNMCCKLSIGETAELFKQSELLISTDSGILHLGVLSNTPTISLFGPSSVKKWAPKGDVHVTVHKDSECSPCTLFGTAPPCRNSRICLLKITTTDVIDGIKNLLDGNKTA